VFNAGMLLSTHPARVAILAAVVGAMLAAPAAAGAEIVEIGRIAQEATPSCPGSPCLAVSRTTGYQAKVGTERGLMVVPAAGKIVAWTITLSKPGPRQISFFDETLGGKASAGIAVIRPGRKLYGRVVAQSPIQALEPWFGNTVQFPLGRALNVRKGYLIGLSVPTWAPALAVGFGNDTSWRASRPADRCQDTETQTVQTRLGGLAQYRCLYRTARLTYTATLITTPRRPSGR